MPVSIGAPLRLLAACAAVMVALLFTELGTCAHAGSLTHPSGPAPTPSPATSSAPPVPAPTVPAAPTALMTPSPRPPGSALTSPLVPPSPPVGEGGGCGWLDVGCKATEAFKGFFKGLVTSALNPMIRLLSRSVLVAPRVDEMPRVHSLWTTSVWVANTCLVLLVVLGGILLMSYESLQTSYTLRDLIPRVVVAVVAANVNLPMIGQVIDFADAMSTSFMGNDLNTGEATRTLELMALSSYTDGGIVMLILGLVIVVIGFIVLITYVFRIILLILLTAIAPLALICHALPQTERIAWLWWRAVAGVLAIQVAQSLVLATAIGVVFGPDRATMFGFVGSASGMFDLLLVICLLYILARIPPWIFQMVTHGGMSRSPIVRLGHTIAAIWIFRRLAGRRHRSRAQARRKRPAARRPRPRRTSSAP